ncbi:MAG: EAL domain-containing protein [Actinomycetota bacterium]
MVGQRGVDAVGILAAHPRDAAGAGIAALAETLVADGLRGIEISPELGVVSHRSGTLDRDDVGTLTAGEAEVRFSPAARADLVEPIVAVVATALLTARSFDHLYAGWTSQAVSVRRGDGRLVAVSESWGETTGRGEIVVADEDVKAGLAPESHARVDRTLRELRARSEIVEEYLVVKADGSEVPIRATSKAFCWPSGEIRSISTRNEDLTKVRELEERLEDGELLQETLERCSHAFNVRDGELRLIWANQAYVDLVGYELDELVGSVPEDLTVQEDFDADDRERVLAREQDSQIYQEIRYLRGDESTVRVRLQSSRVRLGSGDLRYVSFAEDLTEEDANRHEIGQLRRRLEAMLEHAPGTFTLYDRDLEVVFTNYDKWPGSNLHSLIEAGAAPPEVAERIEHVVESGRPDRWHSWTVGSEIKWYEISAAPVFDDDGNVEGVVTLGVDRTEQVAIERQLAHQATHDDLTGLLDRSGLMEAVGELSDSGEPFSTVFVDLDGFKDVNDTLGHELGDHLLRSVAQRLQSAVGPRCHLGRVGGDEFLVAVGTTAEETDLLADALLRALRSPMELDGVLVNPTGSIGIAHVPAGTSPTEAIRRADLAMYDAKRQGRNRIVRFDVTMEERVAHRHRIEEGLRRALSEDELELHYQPEYDLATGRLLGAEALLRWNDPARDHPVSAGEFIEIAEETGLIGEIGRFVAHRAAQDAADWPNDLTVRLNLSAKQLGEPDLVEYYLGEFARAGLPTSRVCVELTETAIAAPETFGVIDELSAAGCTIALDDFGTGFSSMAILRKLPVDVIKIDRSFVDGLGTEPDDTVLVRSIVGLAQSLGHDVVAEGVETELHVHELLALGCRRAQGFGLDRPMPLRELRTRFDAPPPALLGHDTPVSRLIP